MIYQLSDLETKYIVAQAMNEFKGMHLTTGLILAIKSRLNIALVVGKPAVYQLIYTLNSYFKVMYFDRRYDHLPKHKQSLWHLYAECIAIGAAFRKHVALLELNNETK